MLIKTRGIVFRSFKYSETSLICHVYTEAKGLRSYIVSGVRARNPKMPAILFQVGSLLEIVAYDRTDDEQHNRLMRIKEARPALVYQQIPFHLNKGVVALFMAELCSKAIREAEANASLFDFLYTSFALLDQISDKATGFALVFALQLTRPLGILPSGQHNLQTPYFDLNEGCFVSHPNFSTLDEQLSKCFTTALNTQLTKASELNLNREQRWQTLEAVLRYYKLHLEGMHDLNTHKVLREIF